MPTYDYLCEACGPFEHFHSIKDAPLEVCPKCGGKTKRLISKNVNIIFKGSGFYTTDNPTSSYAEGMKSDGASSSTPASSKPAETSAPAPAPAKTEASA